jgi:pimeloyl-[acyl-carrier protein] methyl ester esterase
MTCTLLYVHGWGFTPSFWQPLIKKLPKYPFITYDLGFFNHENHNNEDLSILLDKTSPVIAIGHSYGLQWLADYQKKNLHPFKALISINGFTCFARKNNFPEGIAPLMIEKMKRECQINPVKTLKKFHDSLGSHPPLATPHQGNLSQALEKMMIGDHRDICPDLSLCGLSDSLLSKELSLACFSEEIKWHQGGHLLPLDDPRWCAEAILDFIESFDD